MKSINKQKFLNELGRLLTFMHEDDRQKALAMYNSMFDEAADEFAVIRVLGSPTRQAVLIARAYNAQTGKLQLHSQIRDDQDGSGAAESAPFISVIEGIRAEVRKVVPDALEFDARFPKTEPVKVSAPVEKKPAEALSDVADSAPADSAADNSSAVTETKSESAEAPVLPALSGAEKQSAELRTRTKTRGGLLVIYILLAIPVTFAGICLLLIPAVLSAVIAAACICFGITLVGAALGSFGVLADKLVVIAAAIALFALGLLFLWAFIWLLAGAVAGLVRGVCRLGKKCCCREVAEQ